ncbi:MAG: hypothetical protein KGI27_00540 [Thaumarchaeota archaeon]|nr:hypothetical protein [Nitrososphaerota archaeon]
MLSYDKKIPVMSGKNYAGFSLSYKITNSTYNKILGAQTDEKNRYLSLTLDVARSGTLSISVPRKLLDSDAQPRRTVYSSKRRIRSSIQRDNINYRTRLDNSFQGGSEHYGDSSHAADLIL